MKRYIFNIWMMILVAMLSVACSNSFTTQPTPEPVWDEASILLYTNIGQLYDKGKIGELDFTKFVDTTANDNKARIEAIQSLLRDPSSLGIALDRPAYIVIKEVTEDLVVRDAYVAIEVSDISKLDNTLKTLGDESLSATVSLEGEKRIISFEDNMMMGYDSKRLIFMYQYHLNEGCSLRDKLISKLDYLPADMSRFGSQDVAIYMDIDKLVDDYLATIPEIDEEAIAKIEDVRTLYAEYFEEQASCITGLAFENGAIILSSDFDGLGEGLTSQLKEANPQHLRLLNASPIAILNAGINGEALADILNVVINRLQGETSAIGANNELNIYKNVALGVIGSIDGNLMLALSDAEGKLIDDVIDGKRLVFTKANALFTADVKDDYIMKNVETYGSGLLSKNSKNSYSIEAFGNKVSIGQRENMFYLGINNHADEKNRSAADEEWSNNIMGSYAYAMINFKKLFNTSFGRAALSSIYSQAQSKEEREAMKLATNFVDQLYILLNGDGNTMHAEWTILLRDTQNNALEQIVSTAYSKINHNNTIQQ